MPVEYKLVLLVVNYVAKIPLHCKHFCTRKSISRFSLSQHWQNCTPKSGIEGGGGTNKQGQEEIWKNN